MSNVAQVKEDYDRTAPEYTNYLDSPQGILEQQLVEKAIGDATGLLVLDVGGGSGAHARRAVDLGAKRVDVVDVSPEMLRVGKETEATLGREGRIRYYEADVSKPLDHLPLDKQYDIVMANWVFDHAGSLELLEGMWSNISAYLKPGGKFLGIRIADLESPACCEGAEPNAGRYGASFRDHEPIPGGKKYIVKFHTKPPFEFEATSMAVSYSGSTEMHTKYGFTDVQVLPVEEEEVVKKDPEFWASFVQRPFFAVVVANKV
jgi:SAM-dependent methyltransferase